MTVLLLNGGFENYLSNWILNNTNSFYTTIGTINPLPHNGSRYAQAIVVNSSSNQIIALEQTIKTAQEGKYTLTFSYNTNTINNFGVIVKYSTSTINKSFTTVKNGTWITNVIVFKRINISDLTIQFIVPCDNIGTINFDSISLTRKSLGIM